jgi:ABC-2 type transport system permease protein
MSSNRYHPLRELVLCRFRSFYREPEAVFWTYGFPLILIVGLGIAFRSRPPEHVKVDVVDSPDAAAVVAALQAAPDGEFDVTVHPDELCDERLRLAKTSLVVQADGAAYTYRYDPSRPECPLARALVDAVLQRAAGRQDAVPTTEKLVTEPGSRYIDFLVPGLLGLNLMGGGMWGIGFVLVDMRVRKLLKRLIASPMRRSDLLLSLVGGRMLFTIPEVAVVLTAGVLLFRITVAGSVISVAIVALAGAISFAGLGLLAACRADRIETVTGLLNLVMLPMWIFSGNFFSYERFPAQLQPFIRALPLTQLNDALRAVILEGRSLPSQWFPLLYLTLIGAVSFTLALRWFRWG